MDTFPESSVLSPMDTISKCLWAEFTFPLAGHHSAKPYSMILYRLMPQPCSHETNIALILDPIFALIKTPPVGSSERYVKVAGNREEVKFFESGIPVISILKVTQCIYHICCALLDSPIKGETRLYR